MKKLLSVFLMLMLATSPAIAGHVIDSKDKPEYLFVLSSESGSFAGDTLALTDVPLVVYFSDRPNRIAGHTSLTSFVEAWGKGTNSFKVDPPNATLSIMNESGNQDVIVEISNPQLQGDSLTFNVRVLEGEILESFGPSSLFIDLSLNDPNPGDFKYEP